MIFFISFVCSVSTQVNVNENTGLQIFYPQIDYVKQDTTFKLHLHVSNISNGFPLTNIDVDCHLHLYNSSGHHIYMNGLIKDGNGWDHEVTLTGGNFSDIGQHAFYIWCNTTNIGGVAKGIFVVTESGIKITEEKSILIVGLLLILILFLFANLFVIFSVENYIVKFSSYWISHIILILICFVAWQVGVEGLLIGIALTEIFKILFYVSIFAVVPMVFLSMAWIFYIHTFNEHFQALVDRGVDSEEAFAIAKKKSGGWFNGR